MPAEVSSSAERSGPNGSRDSESEYTSVSVEDAYGRLGSTSRGLGPTDALARLRTGGPNERAPVPRASWELRLLANFYQVFALLLWLSAALAFASTSPTLGWAIIVVIVINALFSFYRSSRQSGPSTL